MVSSDNGFFFLVNYQPAIRFSAFRDVLVGHGVKMMVKNDSADKPDLPYEAIMQSFKAAISCAIKRNAEPRIDQEKYLVECWLTETGDFNIEKVDRAVVAWKYTNPLEYEPLVLLCTRQALPAITTQLKADIEALVALFEKKSSEVALMETKRQASRT